MSYRHTARSYYDRRHGRAEKKTKDEHLWDDLNDAWEALFLVRARYRRNKASLEDVKLALKRVKKLEKVLGSRLLDEDYFLRSLTRSLRHRTL